MAAARTTDRQLWFGVAAGATAWATHSLIINLICSQACKAGRGGTYYDLTPGAVRILLGVVTVILLCVALGAGLTAFRNWRQLSGQASLREDQAESRTDFMALIGLFASAIFVVGIIWAGLPVILVSLCSNYH